MVRRADEHVGQVQVKETLKLRSIPSYSTLVMIKPIDGLLRSHFRLVFISSGRDCSY